MDLLFTTSRDNLQLQIGTFGQLKKEKRLIANEALNKLSTFKFEMKACIADVEQGHGAAEGVERLKRYIEIGARTVENFGVCMQFVERPWKKGPFRQSEKLT